MIETLNDLIAEAIIWIIGILCVAVLAAAILVPVFTLINHDNHVACLRLHEQTGYPTKTVGTVVPDCYILFEDQWIPEDNWIVNSGN